MKTIVKIDQSRLDTYAILDYNEDGTIRDGCGYSCIGEGNPGVNTVMVDGSDEAIVAMIAAPVTYPPIDNDEFPAWKAGIAVKVAEVYTYLDGVYQVVQSHTTQADWTPPVVPALWKKFYDYTSDVPPQWVQPTGAQDAYPLGAKVLHKTYIWQSLIAANVWEPGSVGAEALWKNLTPPPVPPVAEWGYPVAYKVGDIVTYLGKTYKCLQAHTSISTWTPAAVPALWQLQ